MTRSRWYLLVVAGLALGDVGCSSILQPPDEPYAGGLQDLSWKVDCATTTLHDIEERWEYTSPNWCDAENLNSGEIHGYGMCAEWMRIRFRYEWAKAEFRQKCEQHS